MHNFLPISQFSFIRPKLLAHIRWSIAICLLGLNGLSAFAQSADLTYTPPSTNYDTNYITTFPNHVTGRLYLSRKFTSITFEEQSEKFLIDFQPNTSLNFGIGATVRGFTLNLAYGFRFLNQDESKGKTEYLDLQSHMYSRKYAIDLFGQFYRGMYLQNTPTLFPEFPVNHYLRPDIAIFVVGGSFFRVANDQKFSYSASLVQNEWQKKSAGSFLYGAKAMLVAAISDSSMIPTYGGDSLFNSFIGIDRMSTVQIGPGIGYTHTFVMWKHFFVTLSLDLNVMIGHVAYRTPIQGVEEWQANPSVDLRIAMGYNSLNSYFGLSYVEDENRLKSEDGQVHSRFGIGNVRINYVKRFRMGPKLEDRLEHLLPKKKK